MRTRAEFVMAGVRFPFRTASPDRRLVILAL